MSNSVQSNLKSREISPYRRYPANTLVPEQLPAPLDSASFGIGQLSSGKKGWQWTVPATKSDSCPSGSDGAGRDAQRWPVSGAGCPGAPGGDGFGGLADQVPVEVAGVVVSSRRIRAAGKVRRRARGPRSVRRGRTGGRG